MLEVNKRIQQAKEELTEWGIEIIVKEVLSVDEKNTTKIYRGTCRTRH